MGFRLTSWKVLGASVEGSGHRRNSTGCQDSHAWTLVAPSTLVAAVADGAGSARLAADGSRIAARFSVEYVAWRLSEHEQVDPLELLGDAMIATRRQLVNTAKRARHPVGDLATTLALVIASPGGVWAAQVGDGSVVVDQPDGSLLAVADGEREEYLNETTFLTSKNWASACQLEEISTPV